MEDELVGWHHRLNGHEFEQVLGDGEGQGGLACCSPWGRKEVDRTEQLNNNNDTRRHNLEQIKFSFNMGLVITGSITVMRFKLIHSCKKCGMTPGPRQEINKSLLLPTYTEHFLWERCIVGRAYRHSTQTNRSLHGTLPYVVLMESSLCLLVQMCVCIYIHIYIYTHTRIYIHSQEVRENLNGLQGHGELARQISGERTF